MTPPRWPHGGAPDAAGPPKVRWHAADAGGGGCCARVVCKSYFGPFTIHADEGYVVHHRIGHTSPSQMGTDAQRFYEFTENQLILKPPVAMVEGQQVQSYIRWNWLGDVK